MTLTFFEITKDKLNSETRKAKTINVIRIQPVDTVVQGKQGQPVRASWTIYAKPGQTINGSDRVKYGMKDFEILSVYNALDENNKPHHTKVVI